MKKIIYGLLVTLFIAGGLVTVANSANLTSGRTSASPTPPGQQQVHRNFEPSPFGDYFRRESDSVVSIVHAHEVARAEDLTFADVSALVREAVALAGGLESIVSDGDTVILKPNLVTARCNTLPGWQGRWLPPEVNGNSTDYRVTRAVAQMVRELNPTGRIYIIEGPAHSPTEDVFRRLNYTLEHIPEIDDILALDQVSGGWREFDSPYIVRVEPENPLFRDAYYLNRLFFEANAVINIPTLKNHWETVTTGAVKNIGIGMTPANIYSNTPGDNHRFGVPHGVMDLHRFIADYYMIRPSDFVVMDALQGLAHGPTPSYSMSGIRDIRDAQKNMRSILASSDGLAIDVVQTNIMNWDIDTVYHLQYLAQAGFNGNLDSRNIVVLGASVDELRTDFGGVIPVTGGRRLTLAAPPRVSIESGDYDGEFLRLWLDACANTDKIDIYLDGFYLTSVHENFAEISIEMHGLFGDERYVTVYAFDNRMQRVSASTWLAAASVQELPEPGATEPPLTQEPPPFSNGYPGWTYEPPPSQPDVLILRINDRHASVYLGCGEIVRDTFLEAAPFIAGGRTMVPFRFIGETLGAEVDWREETQSAYFIISDGGEAHALRIDVPLYSRDEYMGTPVIVEGRTFVPVRFVSEMMGAEVIWDETAQSITIPF
ncbi:MAG: stalk domain-containing protein [Defluviitaleaceae bacterium]|nr:stalk domain-containing protein [Defluviitaleaceae bacterium]